MAFKQVMDLDCDETVSIGGTNKKTNKANPKSIEGYYLGARTVADRKKKSGHSFIYVFQTPRGKLGVWGKTDLDRKMGAALAGAMTRISFNGMRSTPNGDMYTYKVEIDDENTIDVSTLATEPAAAQASDDAGSDPAGTDYDDGQEGPEAEEDEDGDAPADTVPPAKVSRPAQAAQTPSAERQKKVQSLLAGRAK